MPKVEGGKKKKLSAFSFQLSAQDKKPRKAKSITKARKTLDPTDKQKQLVRATPSCFVSSLFHVFGTGLFLCFFLKRSDPRIPAARECSSSEALIPSTAPFGPERLDLSSSTGLTAEGLRTCSPRPSAVIGQRSFISVQLSAVRGRSKA
jgi:hypothetical protein